MTHVGLVGRTATSTPLSRVPRNPSSHTVHLGYARPASGAGCALARSHLRSGPNANRASIRVCRAFCCSDASRKKPRCVCVCVFVCVCVRACDRMLPRTCVYSHSLRPPEVCATRSLCHQKSVRVHAGKNLIRRPCRARQPQRRGRGS